MDVVYTQCQNFNLKEVSTNVEQYLHSEIFKQMSS